MKQYSSGGMRAIVLTCAINLLLAVLPSLELMAGTTNATADFQLQLALLDTNGVLGATDPIVYELRTSLTNRAKSVFLPEDEYFCQAELFDTNGIAVPKTTIGKHMGSLFDHLEENPKYIRHSGPFNVFLNSTNEIKTKTLQFLEGGSVGPTLFRPVDMFEITNSGTYNLKLHFQFLETTSNDTVRLVQLPVIDVKVHKP